MTVGIVTDSTCDLPGSTAAEWGIEVVPLYVNVGTVSYLDGVDLTREQFYEQLPGYAPPPTTAAPGPATFSAAYERLANAGAEAVISIHISASLSNVVDAARLAASEFKTIPVTVIDSGQLTLGTGLAALAGARLARDGAPVEAIIAAMQSQTSRTHTFAALDTVEYLRHSGRLSRFQSSLATLLHIKPILKMHRGETDMERVRTRKNAFARLISLTSDLGQLEQLAMVHTNAADAAEELREQGSHLSPENSTVLSAQVTPVIGAHIGPGCVGFVCVTKA